MENQNNKEYEYKIYKIISKIEKDDELSSEELEENIEKKLKKALEKGAIDIFYSVTDEGYSFETKYNLKSEQLEFLIDDKVLEFYKLSLDEMTKIADKNAEEFHQDYSSLSLESENKKYWEKEKMEAQEFYKNKEIRESKNNGILDKVKDILGENKEEKIFRIISKDYELLKPESFHMDSFSYKNLNGLEENFKSKAKEALKNGKIDLFVEVTDEGYKFETKYNLKNEKIEVFIDGKLRESTKVKFNDLVKEAHLEKYEFHEKYTKLDLKSKKEGETKNSFLKNILKKEAKSKNNGMEL